MIKLYEDRDANYYGPYTVVCQSSGFGKSRACLSLIDEGFFVVYCCLREKGSNGYPKRSCLAEHILEDINILAYYKCYFDAFIDYLNSNQISSLEFFNKFNQEENTPESNDLVKDLVKSKLNKYSEKKEIATYKGSCPLIFVFDEASSLLKIQSKNKETNNFHIMRKLLSKLKKNIFVLFLDTFSSLSMFMPPTTLDVSARIAHQQMEVFEPIYLLPNWDIYLDETRIKTINDTVKFENLCMYGRALWGSWLEAKSNSNGKYYLINTSKLYTLAWQKLICCKKIESVDLNDILAILSTRLGVIKPKSLSSCQNLVARNMAVSVYVNNKKDLFEISYPSEPILAEASAYLMHRIGYEKVVDSLLECLESCLISKGEKGETISKLILLIAKDMAVDKSKVQEPLKYLDTTKVGVFLQSLYGKCEKNCGNVNNNWNCSSKNKNCCIQIIKEQIKNHSVLLNGLLNFNHFVRPKNYMLDTMLMPALKRCAAYQCRQNEKSIDFVIPVCINESNFDSISALMIQVKLYHHPNKIRYKSYVDYAFNYMSKDFCYLNGFLVLYMQLGEPKNKKPFICSVLPKEQNEFTDYQAIIYTQGISSEIFPNLNSTLASKLVAFSQANEKLFQTSEDSDNNEIYDSICNF